MNNLTDSQLIAEKESLSRRTADAKTMPELDEMILKLAEYRAEFERRGMIFVKGSEYYMDKRKHPRLKPGPMI